MPRTSPPPRIYFAGKKAITRASLALSLARESEVKKGPEWEWDGGGGGGIWAKTRLQLFTDDDSKRNYGDTNGGSPTAQSVVENAPQWSPHPTNERRANRITHSTPSPCLSVTATALRVRRGASGCKGHKSGTQVGIGRERTTGNP